ncbi:fumarylacetoacetate hydrolase family protein [Listeria costaricensis]|uniref:fumarylacetoacetate hydrolase family protein n=1 Tax=Listeria costaricensis TaxID=2026604 RepID=UPI000C0826BA|nr:fumarylacetoacetate hydrolase family protein [Listeria costaricensis]
MKWISFRYQGKQDYGVLTENEEIFSSEQLFGEAKPSSLLAYIEQPQPILNLAQIPCFQLKDVVVEIPIIPPNNVMAVGKNYYEHVLEMGSKEDVPEKMMLFTKSKNALLPHAGHIELHQSVTSQLDYEGELAVIIGKKIKNATLDEADQAIFGFTILNDITARDLQKQHKQFFIGKSLDTSAPMGPVILQKSRPLAEQSFSIQTLVNGELRQNGTTDQLIFPIAQIVAELSQGHTLLPGDIIATGTPKGVGKGMKPPQFLKEGDQIEIIISGIGTLKNTVVRSTERKEEQ